MEPEHAGGCRDQLCEGGVGAVLVREFKPGRITEVRAGLNEVFEDTSKFHF
jgi:hypothetical protein